MSAKVLFTGGAACGKSYFAEQLIRQLPEPYYYIATMQPYGADGQAKVAKHRAMRRDIPFTTIERYHDIGGIEFPQRGTVLFEDITNLVADEMFAEDGFRFDIADELIEGCEQLIAKADDILIITNEVGRELYPYTPETRAYIETLGAVNAAIAAQCDAVYEFVAGTPIELKAPARPIPQLAFIQERTVARGGAA